MTKLVILAVAAVFVSGTVFAKPKQAFRSLPHMDLEMTGAEYEAMMNSQGAGPGDFVFSELQDILDVGKRNLDWLRFINDSRDAQHKISFSSADTQAAYPMDNPRTYNPALIRAAYNDLLTMLPPSIKSVVVDAQPFTKNPSMPDDQYLQWGRKVDSSYQLASRWGLMSPFLSQLELRKVNDIRGYYYLSQMPDVQAKLTGFGKLDPATQSLFTSYLVEMCLNTDDGTDCNQAVSAAVAQNNVYNFYLQYLPVSKQTYDNYFVVLVKRTDVTWNKAFREEMHVPFTEPQDAAVKKFLVDNIQGEWKWTNWNLLLDFGAAALGRPQVDFQPGATPHVEALAGNTITMDANQPLTEYNVLWTIRHEFGHVLGFPDCYLEFYDSATNVITSYQIDITNIMCSRRGHLQQLHYNELKKAYEL